MLFNQALWQFTFHLKCCIYIVLHIYVTQSHSDFFTNPRGVDLNKSCGKEEKSTKWCILQGCPDQAKQEEVNSQRCQWWFRLWWHCRFWWLINVCKLYECKVIIILILYLLISSYQLPPSLHIIMSSHYHIATDQKITWGTLLQKNPENVTVWHGSSMEYNRVFYEIKPLKINSLLTSMHIWWFTLQMVGYIYIQQSSLTVCVTKPRNVTVWPLSLPFF